MSELKGKSVLITGAASGIGRRMAMGAAADGARIVGWDLNAEGLADLLAELPGPGHQVDTVDVTNRARVYEAAERVGAIDVLINNAGVVSGRSLLEISDEKIERTLHVNTFALFWTTRAFLPEMVRRGEGHIVTVASAAGLIGVSGLVDYSASKFAAVGFDEALRTELARIAPGVKTTLVCPFYIDTGMFDGVKTRFSFLLPILKEEDVAKEILKAIRKNRPNVVLPKLVRFMPLMRLLPVRTFDQLAAFLGVSASMDEFRGRGAA